MVEVKQRIEEVRELVQKRSHYDINQMFDRIEKYFDCFKQLWFWHETRIIFNDYQKSEGNNKALFKCIFCMVVFLQDKRLKGYPLPAVRGGEKSTDIFKEGIKRIDDIVKDVKLNQYLHFILTKQRVRLAKTNSLSKNLKKSP